MIPSRFLKLVLFIFNCYSFNFWLCYMACGILVSQPGLEHRSLHWKCGLLTTRPPGKSPFPAFKMKYNLA